MRFAVRDRGDRWAAGIRAELGGVGLDEIDMAFISAALAHHEHPPALRHRELPPQLGKRHRARYQHEVTPHQLRDLKIAYPADIVGGLQRDAAKVETPRRERVAEDAAHDYNVGD